ncbi:hypothetical protein TWF481_011944 [Arthrobotrys musiformis]|uniref:Uncharacterized protein n=1 Tax=Arthrobotrys musiformis TaxID=47236 RepID=A0AAV9VXK7_9PEZI
MHISLPLLLLLPLAAAAVPHPHLFVRKNAWCEARNIERYVRNIPISASSSVKSWCAAQTAVSNGTVNFFATITVTDDKTGGVTRTRTRTETRTRYRRTRTVTVRKTSTTTSPTLAARAIYTPAMDEPIGGNPIKRAVNHGYNKNTNNNNNNNNYPVLDRSKSSHSGVPGNWTNLPDRLLQVLCDCLDSPWKTKNGTWTKTTHHTRTKTRTETLSGTAGTAEVEVTSTKTVDSSGETTVTVTE